MSGYDIKQFLERTVVHFWSESYGQIYPALRELEDRGWITGRDEPGDRGRPRRVYRITEKGREELREWLREPAAPVTPRYEHSLKLFFGRNVGVGASLGHVRRLREQARESLETYREREETLEERATGDPDAHAPYWLVVLRGGIRYAEMVLEWCEETEETLRALEPSDEADGPGDRSDAGGEPPRPASGPGGSSGP